MNIGSGTVYGEITDNGDIYVGAIAGFLQGKIVNCSNSASVTASGKRQTYVGGIVGSGGTIERYHNSGTVTATNGSLSFTYAGGIAGSGQLSNCYNTGKVSVAGIGSYYTNNVSGIGGTNSSSTYNTGVLSARNNTENFSVRHGSTYYLNSLAAPENEKATPKTDVEFAKGEVAYLLNGSQDAPNGPWYQNLTGPNCDPHPVLDPTHPAVYKVNGKYVNATYRSIANPTVTMDGGISLVELVSKLPKTVEVTSTIGTSTANVTWNTDSIKYDPKNFNTQTVTVSGTANVTGLLNGGEKPVTATVKVNAVTVNGLTVTTAPNLTYSQGGKLNLGNVKVTAKFSNGAVEILEHDTEGVTFVLGDQNIADGAALDKAQHNSQTLTLSYGGKTVELGQLVVQSTNNQISALTVSDQEAQYENGGYAVTLPPYSALPNADGIAVTLADASATVTGKKQLSAGDSEAQWQITVRAENGDTADYLLTVTVSPDYALLNQKAVDEFTAAWNSLTKNWTPTQAQVQQDTTTAGVEYQQQLTFWLTSQLLDNGVNIPDNATVAIDYTSGPNWAVEGSRQDHDGTPGSFAFTLTFTATAGADEQHKSVSFTGEGTITPIPYDAPSYTVNFDPQNGSEVSSAQVTEDTPIGNAARPADPSRENYRFTGWTDENGIHYDFSTTVTASVELAAPSNSLSLSPPAFEFYVGDPDNGGTSLGTVDAQQTEGGYTASLDVELTNGNGFTKAGTYTIYAVFSGSGELDGSRSSHGLEVAPAIYTVTFDSSGGTPVASQYIVDGQTITEPEDPTKDGYHFGGWKQGERLWNFQRDTVAENMTLSAAWGYVPVFDITGSVTDQDSTALPNVKITLQQGTNIVFKTVTNEQGQYKFEKVSPGLYNIVAERTVEQSGQQTTQTVTALVEIIDADKTPPTLKMSPANVSFVLKVPENAPNIVVGGLTEEAVAVANKIENQGAAVTVNMTVEPKAPVTGTPAEGSDEAKLQQEQQAIQQQAASRTLNFHEIAVVKTVGAVEGKIKETQNLLEIAVDFDFTNRENVTVYRYHDGQAQALTQVNARAGANQDGTYYLDRENGLIHIFTQQFSLYAIGYTVPTPGGNGGGGNSSSGGSGSPSYAVDTDAKTDHVTVTVKPSRAEKGDTVTITAKPDKGYQVGKVTVTDKNGDTIKVTDKGDGKYTFTMPGGKVSVDVTFVAEKQWTNPFADVAKDAWYYDAVKYVNENGLMAGTSATTFEPDLTTTRGMIVAILHRLAGSPNIEDEIWGYPFQDVDANAYYATAVYWARMNGIVAGYSDERFGPNDTITREQMATILYRYAQYKVYDTTDKANLSKYTDTAQVGSYAVEAIRWANAEGLVNGTSATTLTPKGSATRAQAAAILMRFGQKYVEK